MPPQYVNPVLTYIALLILASTSVCFTNDVVASGYHDNTDYVAVNKQSGNPHDDDALGNSNVNNGNSNAMGNSHADNGLVNNHIHDHGAENHHHDNHAENGEKAKEFLQEIFLKYGENGKMTFEGFEHLLVNLGLGNVWIDDHDVHDHHTELGFNEFHEDHTHNATKHDSKEMPPQKGGRSGRASEEVSGNLHSGKEDGENKAAQKILDLDGEGREVEDPEENEAEQNQQNFKNDREVSTDHRDRTKRDTSDGIVKDTESEIARERVDAGIERGSHVRIKRHLPRDEEGKKCLSPREILQAAHIKLAVGSISPQEFSAALCPAIVYQLDAHVCHSHEPCDQAVKHNSRASHCSLFHGCTLDAQKDSSNRSLASEGLFSRLLALPPKVWGMALIAVTVISLCGLGSVAIIPIMDRLFYNQLLQFLIALAVGTLTGDAMLHLLPHAMLPHGESAGLNDHHGDGNHGDDDHGNTETQMIYKGLTVLGGVYFFFIMERIVQLYGAWKKKRTAKRKLQLKLSTLGEQLPLQQEMFSLNEKESQSKHHHHHHHHDDNDNSDDTDELSMMQVNFSKQSNLDQGDLNDLGHDDLHKGHHKGHDLDKGEGHHLRKGHDLDKGEGHHHKGHDLEDYQDHHLKGHDDLEEYEGHHHKGHDLDENGGHHKGHGHGHGHSHSVPKSVGSAAWMVIMGDGLHNFTDGLAIGASFATSISVGLSTSVAVFCHELPHELGDFAVLLKAGMTVKQALVYNVVSSVLCLFGMLLGLILGNVESSSAWIFTATAGIFIYIALVDMLPEMTGALSDEDIKGSLITVLLHSIGIACGVSVMLVIALFVEKIQILAGDNL